MNDAVLLESGMSLLVEHLGLVEAERFVYLMNKEPFDYTKWQENLYEGMTVREICEAVEIESDQTEKTMAKR